MLYLFLVRSVYLITRYGAITLSCVFICTWIFSEWFELSTVFHNLVTSMMLLAIVMRLYRSSLVDYTAKWSWLAFHGLLVLELLYVLHDQRSWIPLAYLVDDNLVTSLLTFLRPRLLSRAQVRWHYAARGLHRVSNVFICCVKHLMWLWYQISKLNVTRTHILSSR